MIHSIINRFIILLAQLLPLSFVRMFAGRYVAGESSHEALKIVRELNEKSYSVTLDILGEHSQNKFEACAITQEYVDLYENVNLANRQHYTWDFSQDLYSTPRTYKFGASINF